MLTAGASLKLLLVPEPNHPSSCRRQISCLTSSSRSSETMPMDAATRKLWPHSNSSLDAAPWSESLDQLSHSCSPYIVWSIGEESLYSHHKARDAILDQIKETRLRDSRLKHTVLQKVPTPTHWKELLCFVQPFSCHKPLYIPNLQTPDDEVPCEVLLHVCAFQLRWKSLLKFLSGLSMCDGNAAPQNRCRHVISGNGLRCCSLGEANKPALIRPCLCCYIVGGFRDPPGAGDSLHQCAGVCSALVSCCGARRRVAGSSCLRQCGMGFTKHSR